MDVLLMTFSMCFVFCSFCFLLEVIETAIKSKANRIYKETHILYSLFILGTLIYLLVSGAIK